MDPGASAHMTSLKHMSVSLDESVYESSITTADDHQLKSKGVGTVGMNCRVDGRVIATRLEDVLYVPGLAMNLISVKQLTARGLTVSFLEGQRCEIRGSYGSLCAVASCAIDDL